MSLRAHRVAWLLSYGDIPDELCVCHHCDNPPCVNPAHLFLGTHTDNMRDSVRKGRHVMPDQTGTSNPQAKLTEADVREIREFYATRSVTQYALAEMFGTSVMTVNCVVLRKTWKHVI